MSRQRASAALRRTVLALASIGAGCERQYQPSGANTTAPLKDAMAAVLIVPGHSIGGIAPGADVATLPTGASQDGRSGQWNGVHFTVDRNKVDEVWIDDLRGLADGAAFDDRVLARNASLEDLKRLLGPCEKTEGVKGGVFFRCAGGIVLGCDFEEKGTFIQIRLGSRP
jgi:hypothetical protein